MSTQEPTTAPAPAAPVAPPATFTRTALDRAIEADGKTRAIEKYLFFVAGKRGLRGADAEDVVFETFRVAFQRERRGECWDPAVEAATVHLAKLLVHQVLANRRRSFRRKPTTPLGDDHDPASEAATVEAEIMDRQESDRRASEVRATLAAQTQSGLTLRILDAMREGIEGHENLAKKLNCKIEDIRAAFRRITRRMEKVRETANQVRP